MTEAENPAKFRHRVDDEWNLTLQQYMELLLLIRAGVTGRDYDSAMSALAKHRRGHKREPADWGFVMAAMICRAAERDVLRIQAIQAGQP
jgi:hypothetical protein